MQCHKRMEIPESTFEVQYSLVGKVLTKVLHYTQKEQNHVCMCDSCATIYKLSIFRATFFSVH